MAKDKKNMVDLTHMAPKQAGLKGPLIATVELGGKTYTIKELPSRKNSEWRGLVSTQFTQIAEIVQAAMGADMQSPEGLAGIIESFGEQVIGAFDMMRTLMFEYSQELRLHKEEIEDESFDSEIIPAFLEVLKLGFPFGSVANKILDLSTAVNSTTRPSKPTSQS